MTPFLTAAPLAAIPLVIVAGALTTSTAWARRRRS